MNPLRFHPPPMTEIKFMADGAPDTTQLTTQDIETLRRLQQQGNVHVHSGSKPVRQNDLSPRHLGAMIAGGLGAALGYGATSVFIDRKMSDFWTAVDAATKDDILGRGGIGAGLAESNAFMGGSGWAGGLSSHEIKLAHARTMAKSGEFGDIPKFIFDFSRDGGAKGMLAMGGALAVGGAAALAAYSMIKDKPEKMSSWSDKIENEPDPTRDRSS